jgi:hypothetical protein
MGIIDIIIWAAEEGVCSTENSSLNIGDMRLFQNFSFWNSLLGFNRKTGPLAGFSKSLFQN